MGPHEGTMRLRLKQRVDGSQFAKGLRRPFLFGRKNLRKSPAYSKLEDMNIVLHHHRFRSPNRWVRGRRLWRKGLGDIRKDVRRHLKCETHPLQCRSRRMVVRE